MCRVTYVSFGKMPKDEEIMYIILDILKIIIYICGNKIREL